MSNYFTDRVVQHPGRITLTPTGGSDEYDVDRAEGTVTTPGTPFNAESMNGAIDLYGFHYGTCSTAAGTAAKVVTCAGFTLVTGAKIAVKFSNGNTYNGQITLNVNGTGAKNVYDYGEFYDGYSRCAWDANQTMIFVYDGTRWNLVNGELITDSALDALETALGISSTTERLYNILDALADRPYIKKQGTQGSWTYRVWSDGTAEAWYSTSGSLTLGTQVGSLYANSSSASIAPPSEAGFSSIDYADVTVSSNSYHVWASVWNITAAAIYYRALSTSSRTSAIYGIRAYIKGTSSL